MAKAVFLDRDGTIVKGAPFISSLEELVLLPNSAAALRLFKKMGFQVIIATNQSGIARGYFTEERLKEIHDRLQDMLSQEGAMVDAIYYCPHLPEGAVTEYSIECQCRKPRSGMLLRAAREQGISLRDSFMIGDTPVDILAGKNAGCKTVLIKNHGEAIEMPAPYQYGTGPVEADFIVGDVWKAAQIICSEEEARLGAIASEAKQSHYKAKRLLRGSAPRNDNL